MDPLFAKRIEHASLRAWPAVESTMLDGWELRSAGGFTKRANSVQAFGPSSRALPFKVGECEEWYESRGLPPIFRLTPFSDAELDSLLEEHGYRLVDPTDVLSMPLGKQFKNDGRSKLLELSVEGWVQEYAALTGRVGSDVVHLRSILEACQQERVLGGTAATGEGVARVGCGMAVLDDDLVGLLDLVTAEHQRRRGYGTDLVAGLIAWGHARGARHAYLQVVRTNVPARELYRKLGFADQYAYWYRVREW